VRSILCVIVVAKVVCSLPSGANGSNVHILGKHMFRMRAGWLWDETINTYMWLLQVTVGGEGLHWSLQTPPMKTLAQRAFSYLSWVSLFSNAMTSGAVARLNASQTSSSALTSSKKCSPPSVKSEINPTQATLQPTPHHEKRHT